MRKIFQQTIGEPYGRQNEPRHAVSLLLALFVSLSPISDKVKIRFMYVGAALSLIAVPMMSHYIAGLNNIVDELRYQAVLVFIVVVCCYCFVMANIIMS